MGIFDKIKAGLKKTRDNISGKVDSVFKSFASADEELLEELEEALILADMGVKTSSHIIGELRGRLKAEGTKDPGRARELLREIIINIMSGAGASLTLSTDPSVILVIGVNGVGKTTTIGKLAALLKKEGKRVLLAAGDTFRAAAAEQLSIWAERAGADIVRHSEGADPAAVIYDAAAACRGRGCDVLICDTAGRLHNKQNLMNELSKIDRVLTRELAGADRETLLVIDATTGQNALLQARAFAEAAGVTGIILTKLDGTAKGGVTVAVCDELGIPVKFVCVGEGIDDLMPFDPRAFAEALF